MLTIFYKELKTYFLSPNGYVYLCVFYFFSGLYFVGDTLLADTTDLSDLFASLFAVCLFLVPVLTMRLFSEEYKNKTDQALFTAPITLTELALGKYMAALTEFLLGLCSTLVFAWIVDLIAAVDWAVVIGHFAGLFLLGAALTAIGMFLSACTENQVAAIVSSFAAGLAVMLTNALSSLVPAGIPAAVLRAISFSAHYASFTQGMLDLTDVMFFVSICAVFIFFTIQALDRRRWC